jgi:hypothetical protein
MPLGVFAGQISLLGCVDPFRLLLSLRWLNFNVPGWILGDNVVVGCSLKQRMKNAARHVEICGEAVNEL